MRTITIEELHRTTGDWVRRAGASRVPVVVTDHGQPIAVIANPSLLRVRRRQRTLLPDYETLMAKVPGHDVQEDLDAVRGDR